MVVKNVECQWIFLKSPDENNKFRVEFKVTKEQKDEIFAEMERVAQSVGKKLDDCDWKGSFKDTEGVLTFKAATLQKGTKKNGQEFEKTIPVYDLYAQKMEEIPDIGNGSIMNVAFTPYWSTHKNKKGVMLGLDSVQLIKLEEWKVSNPFSDESNTTSEVTYAKSLFD